MSTTTDKPSIQKQLRDRAEAQLQAGTTPQTGHWSMGIDALRMLHRLSSDPDKAEDALKLLHELQVHQVELDLQNEEIAANEQALVEDLHLYRALYDCAPLAYCVVDREGTVIQGNLAAADLFGVGQDHLKGQQIDTFLTPQNRQQLLDLLQHVAERGARDSCIAEITGGARGSRQMRFLASLSPEPASVSPKREQFLLACCECASSTSSR